LALPPLSFFFFFFFSFPSFLPFSKKKREASRQNQASPSSAAAAVLFHTNTSDSFLPSSPPSLIPPLHRINKWEKKKKPTRVKSNKQMARNNIEVSSFFPFKSDNENIKLRGK